MAIRMALAGNPNCGKTTMFNVLTGSSQTVGNWPGVTVEKKEGKLKGHKDVIVMDLPGIYSLSPYTLEEVISRQYLIQERPDVILNLVDATNLERNLYLTTQLLELGLPMVVALNMIDVVQKNKDTIDVAKLSSLLGCEVIETSALKSTGCKEAAKAAIQAADAKKASPLRAEFSARVEQALSEIETLAPVVENTRWYAVKLFERDEKVMGQIELTPAQLEGLEAVITACEKEMDDDSESIITNERYLFIQKIVKQCLKKKQRQLTTSDKIDRVVTNRFLALPIFAVVMFAVYYLAITTVGTLGNDFVNDTVFGSVIPPAVEGFLNSISVAGWLQSLILDGIISGVGAVLGFLPQMLVLFFLLALLEDCGYMARIAFIMDRIFRKFGLSGKSFIPMLIGSGCGVPGIMASRTIENEKDRKITVMTTTFIPCSAKLPIIALIAGALFHDNPWIGPSAYFVGIAAILVSGIILKKTKLFAGDPAPFVMELPAYHIPGLKSVLMHMWDRAKSFVKKAGTIIFLAVVGVWFLGSFNWSLQMVDQGDSILASIGRVLAPIFAPLGWGHWQAAVATVTGLVAKENVVGTFGILYGFAEVAENGQEIWGTLTQSFTPLAAYSFLVFNLLCAPCFAAIGAIKREMGTARWTMIAVGYQTIFAYMIALCVYQFGTVLSTGGFGVGTASAVLVAAFLLWMLIRPNRTNRDLVKLHTVKEGMKS